jgi:hypothetical protein
VRTADATAIDIALQVLNEIRPDLCARQPRAQLVKLANGEAIAELQEELVTLRNQLSEFQCPYCKAQLSESVHAPLDDEQRDWDVVRTFECGYEDFGGIKRRLCPRDPDFPTFNQYELIFTEENGSRALWICNALGKTESARKVALPQTFGSTKNEAAKIMMKEYERLAGP